MGVGLVGQLMGWGSVVDDRQSSGPISDELAGSVAEGAGLDLAVTLAGLDVADLSDDLVVEVIGAYERVSSWVSAGQLQALAEFSRRRYDGDREFAADQIAPAMTLTRFASELRLTTAEQLDRVFPTVLDGMLAGQISLAKAQIIVEMTTGLDEGTAAGMVTGLIEKIPSWTTGQLRAHLAKAILKADPGAARRRAERAKHARNVWLSRGEDGNASLGSLMDAYDAAAAYEVINHAAKAAQTPGDDRSLGERRSDVLLDFILGRRPTRPAPPDPEAKRPQTAPAHGTDPGQGSGRAEDTDSAEETGPAHGTGPGQSGSAAAEPGPAGSGTGGATTEPAQTPAPAPAPATATGAGAAAGAGSDLNRGASVGTIVNVVISLGTLAALLLTRDQHDNDPPEQNPPAPKPPAPTPPAPNFPNLAALPTGYDQPGWIAGLGPVAGSSVRELVWDLLNGTRATSTKIGWRIVACDDETGAVHALGHTRYRPPAALQELVRLRDQTCTFPGCRRAAIRCDLDHAVAFDPS